MTPTTLLCLLLAMGLLAGTSPAASTYPEASPSLSPRHYSPHSPGNSRSPKRHSPHSPKASPSPELSPSPCPPTYPSPNWEPSEKPSTCRLPLLPPTYCMDSPMCSDCVTQDNPYFAAYGVHAACTSCLAVPMEAQAQCYNCMSQHLPNNTDGSLCTRCACLATDPGPGGGNASMSACYTCLSSHLGPACTQRHSCSDPPANATADEVATCWDCMRQHRNHTWGSGACGDMLPLQQL